MPLASTRHTHLLIPCLYILMPANLRNTQCTRKVNCRLCNVCLILKWGPAGSLGTRSEVPEMWSANPSLLPKLEQSFDKHWNCHSSSETKHFSSACYFAIEVKCGLLHSKALHFVFFWNSFYKQAESKKDAERMWKYFGVQNVPGHVKENCFVERFPGFARLSFW
jgi:hypothetical protein